MRQRTLEIGVRMALGAERGDIAGLVLRYGAFVLILGGTLGAIRAFAASRFVRSLLFNVVPGDPPAFVLALAVLAVAVLAGCMIPLSARPISTPRLRFATNELFKGMIFFAGLMMLTACFGMAVLLR